jgi:putative alpha-1,2-mannosidase
LKLNGANYNKTWIDYNDIQKGGNLNFEMNSVANKEFGISNMSSPYSMTKNN